MHKLKSICKKIGCNELVIGRGYCADHKDHDKKNRREAWDVIDARKTPEQKAFYNSHAWHKASRRHRKIEPLCRRCRKSDIIKQGDLAHHNPPLEDLLARGLNPYLDDYLETLCTPCHNKELRKK